jgi:hypothetical protein
MKEKFMNLVKILFLLLIITFLSCQIYLAPSLWNGKIYKVYQIQDNKIQVTFPFNDQISSTITVSSNDNSMEIKTSGTYYNSSDYTFTASLEGTSGTGDSDLIGLIIGNIIKYYSDPTGISYYKYYLTMDGTLNTFKGVGDGNYTLKCEAHKYNNTVESVTFKDEWEILKM